VPRNGPVGAKLLGWGAVWLMSSALAVRFGKSKGLLLFDIILGSCRHVQAQSAGIGCMSESRILVLACAGALAACGAPADNPENIPLAGKWRDEAKLMSVTHGGVAVDPAKFPGVEKFKAKLESKEFCGEPYFRTKEEFQAEIDRNNPEECVVESVQLNGSRVLATGTCKAVKNEGVDQRLTFRGEATVNAESVVYDMSIQVIFQDQKTGMGDIATVEPRRTMTRLGDC
jgi:hypothetical protein